jgi:hypothetical protein
VFIGGWKIEVFSSERQVGVSECVVMGGWVQVMEGGHGRLCEKFMLWGDEG